MLVPPNFNVEKGIVNDSWTVHKACSTSPALESIGSVGSRAWGGRPWEINSGRRGRVLGIGFCRWHLADGGSDHQAVKSAIQLFLEHHKARYMSN